MKKTVCCIIAFALVITSCMTLFSCGNGEYVDRVIKGKDTYATVRMSSVSASGRKLSGEYFDSVAEGCGRIFAKCDKLMSPTMEDSHINALNGSVDMIVSPDESLLAVLRSAQRVEQLTDGAYSAAMGGVFSLWADGATPSEDEISDALSHTDTTALALSEEKIEFADNECVLDLSGICDGFAAQRLLEYLSAAELAYGVVSVGDSVGVFGEKKDEDPFKIGIKDPTERESVLAYYGIENGFISVACTSDERMIIDRTSGHPADSGIVCAAVWCANGSLSDALSYAAVVMGESRLSSLRDSGEITFEAVLVNDKNEIILTDGIDEREIEVVAEGYTVRKITSGE